MNRALINKILITLGFLFAYRVLAYVPVPGVNIDVIREFFTSNSSNALGMFNMFSGEEQNVEILCNNNLVGVMIDRFGKEIGILKADDEHFRIIVKVAVSMHFIHWIMALGDGVKIIGPESVVEAIRTEIDRLTQQYNL